MKKSLKFMGIGASALVTAGVVFAVIAGDVPSAPQASPDVYKLLAENDQMRVILATWKPGQKDSTHGHPMAAVYTVVDCNRRIYKADGTTDDKMLKAGSARINPPVKSHNFENIGTTECKQVLVELKQ